MWESPECILQRLFAYEQTAEIVYNVLVITSCFTHTQISAESSEEAQSDGFKFTGVLSMQKIVLHSRSFKKVAVLKPFCVLPPGFQ